MSNNTKRLLGNIPWEDLQVGDKVESWQGRIGTITQLDVMRDQQIVIRWDTPMTGAPSHSNPYHNHQVEAAQKQLYYAMTYHGHFPDV